MKASVLLGISILSLLAACGGPTADVGGMDEIPGVSGMLASNSSSAVTLARQGLRLHEVSGTPPNLVDLSWTATAGTANDPDKVFWNGLVRAINTASSATATQATRFWGGSVGNPAGSGGCFMAQSVGESVSRILSAGSSQCYMKNIPNASSGVTITGATAANLFSQSSGNKLVKVAVTNMDGAGSMDVFIRVYGTGSTEGTAGYAADLYMCYSGVAGSLEQIRVNKSTGAVSFTNYRDEDRGGGAQIGKETITAYLKKNSDGTFSYDPSKERSANVHYSSNSWGTFKGLISIDGDNNITTKRFNSYTYTDHLANSVTGGDYNFSRSAFEATEGLSDLKFTEGAFVGWNTSTGGNDHTYSGQLQFQSDHYVTVAAGSFDSDLTSYINGNAKASFQADTFFSSTSLTAATVDSTIRDTNSCSATPNATVTMDFSAAGVIEVKSLCEGERYDNYDICWASAVQTAQNYVWDSMSP